MRIFELFVKLQSYFDVWKSMSDQYEIICFSEYTSIFLTVCRRCKSVNWALEIFADVMLTIFAKFTVFTKNFKNNKSKTVPKPFYPFFSQNSGFWQNFSQISGGIQTIFRTRVKSPIHVFVYLSASDSLLFFPKSTKFMNIKSIFSIFRFIV